MTTSTCTGDSATQIPVRLDFDAHAPAFARAMGHLDHTATKELDRVDFDARLRELVRVRASQINGCAYCIDLHTKDARAIGETQPRLYAPRAGGSPRTSASGNGPRWRSPSRSPCWPASTSRPATTTRSRRGSARTRW